MSDMVTKPSPLNDVYWLSIKKAYEKAKDPNVPMDLVPEFIDAAEFFGRRMNKARDDVMRDCINFSIFMESGGAEYE